MNAAEGQSALLSTASGEKLGDDVRISLYKSLATNAKFFGGHLSSDQVASLDKIVESAASRSDFLFRARRLVYCGCHNSLTTSYVKDLSSRTV